MSRPKLVYLCTRFPWPLDRGDRLRAWNLLRQFSRHADVTLISFSDLPAERVDITPLLDTCERVEVVSLPAWQSRLNLAAGVLSPDPLQVSYYRSEIMDRLVDRLVRERFDVAFAQLFRMFPYLERFPCRKILELSDSLALNLRRAIPVKPPLARIAFREELRRVEPYEAKVMKAVDENWVVAPADREDLLRRAPGARVEVIPNGIVTRWGRAGLDGPKQDAALFLGNLTVGHNIDTARYLALDIWPRVLRRKPDARLVLAGAAGRAVNALAAEPGVRVAGFVDDLGDLLRTCRLAVSPLRYGAGIQNKVLETMAAGLPVVVTPIVAEPIGAEPGREILVAREAEEIAAEIVSVMEDPDRARSVGEAGSRFVLGRYSWDRAGERMGEILGAAGDGGRKG